MKFLIAIEPGTERTAFGVIVPDLPGCFSAGDTLDEAFAMAAEAIDGHVEILLEDGVKLPPPADPAVHMANPDYAGMAWGYVDVPVERYLGPAQKINITVPVYTLRRIDEYARRHGLSRSGFLVEAASRVIAANEAPAKA